MQKMARGRAVWISLALALALAACDDGGASHAEHLQKAQEYRVAGDLPSAIVELKNALQADPDSADARAMLGEIYLLAGDADSASKELLRARELGRTDDALRRSIVQAWLLKGDYAAVLEELPEDPEITDDVSADLAAARGEALFGTGEVEAAATLLRSVVEARGSAGAYVGLIAINLFRDDLAAADRNVDEGRSRHPDDARLATLEGELFLRERQFAEAGAAFTRAIEMDPRHFGARLGLARAQVGEKKLEDAGKTLAELAAENPESLDVALLQSVVALQSGDYTEAQQGAGKVLATNDGNAAAQFVSGASSYALEQNEQAVRALGRYVAQVPGDSGARKLLAASHLRLGEPEEADRVLAEMNDETAQDSQYVALLSTSAAMRGDPKAGVKLLEQAVVRSPEDAELRARLGLMRIATGDLNQGAIDLDEAIQLNPQLEEDPTLDAAERTLILGHIRRGEYDAAIEAAEELQQKNPERTSGYVLAGIAYMGKGDDAGARAAFNKALEIQPGVPDASANLAMLEYQGGNIGVAETILLTAHEKNPTHLNTMMLLARLAAEQGKYDETGNWATKAIEAHPQEPTPRVMLARLMLKDQKAAEALTALQPLLGGSAANSEVLELAGTAQLTLGRTDDGVATLEKLVTAAPDRAQAHFLLAKAYGQAGRASEARQELTEALAIDSGHGPAKLALGRLLVMEGDAPRAQPIVADLAATYPTSPEVALLRADLAMLQDDPAAAVPILQKLQPDDRTGRVTASLARAQWQAGDREAATATLQEWIAGHPTDTGMRLELSRYYVALGRTDEAKAALAEITEDDPQEWVARNELAYLLYDEGDLAAARPLAEKAYELSEQHPMVADTLAVIFLAQNEAEKALPLLRDAATQLPSFPQVSYHLARALVETGKREEARQVLASALAAPTPFDEREAAEALLRELGG